MSQNISQLSDIDLLKESAEVECKLASGRDGQGAVPDDMWQTYSAFANTSGGKIFLGVRERKGKLSLEGIKTPAKLVKNIWDSLNNPQKVSGNLLKESDVSIECIQGNQIICINVPRSSRHDRPVYINGNPLTGSYIRRYEADQKCSSEQVQRMLAERQDARDNKILQGFGVDDVDDESLRIYRQMFKDAKPQGHPFLEQDDLGFLRSIKAWRKDRQTGEEGLTLAGLLMFGTWDALQEALPNYFLDYQEKGEGEARWIDRVFCDGSWTGNIFDFYRKIYRKLTSDLKLSFTLKDGQRVDQNPAHEAIREALVNTLAHADYLSDSQILVEKYPDYIRFRNPGLMRVPVKDAIAGGESICRNPAIHQMFLNIGLSEKAGSGVPKIYSNCRLQNWQPPNLFERYDIEQTILELRMVNLIPEEITAKLVSLFGDKYQRLNEIKKLILQTAITENWFTHERICLLTSANGREVTLALSSLVSNGMLVGSGEHKSKVYHLADEVVPTPENESGQKIEFVASPKEGQLSLTLDLAPDITPDITPDIAKANEDLWKQLVGISEPIRKNSGRPSKADVRQTIVNLCMEANGKYMKVRHFSELLDIKPDTIRKNYLTPMVKEQILQLAYPTATRHPDQGYAIKE
ncbi:RNA-binding domain-containing protein [Catenovulum sediminis]|uniref:RNA-binding domain-containing protein n=1 Tax=Catenovulum sediminis TaxID=1740262 RepID=A0ABV1RDP1_9ALTE